MPVRVNKKFSLLLILAMTWMFMELSCVTCLAYCSYGDCDYWHYPSLADIEQYHWYEEVYYFMNYCGEIPYQTMPFYQTIPPYQTMPLYSYGSTPALNLSLQHSSTPAVNQATGGDANYWLNQGDSSYLTGSYEQAAVSYAEAVKLNPSLSEGWFNMGNAFYFLGRYNQSINAYDALLQLEPQNSNALMAKSKALLALGQNEDADAAANVARTLQDRKILKTGSSSYAIARVGRPAA
jgi:tetratricopeptide (TPR) repeat protein